MNSTDDFVHTDKSGFPVKCANCLSTIEHKPAVKISNSFVKSKVDGPWPISWSISYTYYCENCAVIVLLKKRGSKWPKFLIRLVFGVYLKSKK